MYVETKNNSNDIVSLSMTLKIKVGENKVNINSADDNTVLRCGRKQRLPATSLCI